MTTSTTTPPLLASPYSDLPEEYQKRLNATISVADWNLVRAVCPLHGTYNAIIGTFIKHVTTKLRQRGIQHYDPDALIRILHECTNIEPIRHATAPDDGRGEESVRASDSTNESQSTNTSGSSTVRGGRTRRRGSNA